jgi:acetyl esterase/lipase
MNVTVQGIEAAQLRGTLIRLRYAAWLKKLGHFTCALVVAYAAACSYLWLTQGSLIFNPDSQIDLTPEDYGIAYREVRIPVTDASQGELHGWWLPARGERVLVYLHGNSGNIGSNLPHAVRFHKLGFSVLLFDYRGFGQSRGSFPSEEHLYEDAWSAWNWLLKRAFEQNRLSSTATRSAARWRSISPAESRAPAG